MLRDHSYSRVENLMLGCGCLLTMIRNVSSSKNAMLEQAVKAIIYQKTT